MAVACALSACGLPLRPATVTPTLIAPLPSLLPEPTVTVTPPKQATYAPSETATLPASANELPSAGLLTLVADATGDLDEFRLLDGKGETIRSWDVFTRTSGAFNYYAGYPAVSPDGHWMAVLQADEVVQGFVVDLHSSAVRGPYGFDAGGDWSPDSQRLAFTTQGKLGILDMATDQVTLVTPGGSLSPRWSPDGRQLAFYQKRQRSTTEGFVAWPYELHVMEIGGAEHVVATDALLIVNDLMLAGGLGGWGPAWSPDGLRIAYESGEITPDLTTSEQGMDLKVVAVRDQEIEWSVSQPGNEGAPAWSPDGTHLAFVHTQRSGAAAYVLSFPDGDVTRLSPVRDDMQFVNPVWSPDGQWVALCTYYGGVVPSLAVIRPDGTDLSILAPASSEYQRPIWLDSNGR